VVIRRSRPRTRTPATERSGRLPRPKLPTQTPNTSNKEIRSSTQTPTIGERERSREGKRDPALPTQSSTTDYRERSGEGKRDPALPTLTQTPPASERDPAVHGLTERYPVGSLFLSLFLCRRISVAGFFLSPVSYGCRISMPWLEQCG
jgi:hypothetical protein